ncbi:hypothetical protein [Clostridium sp.]|jgi:hypothetical protein|uniref:hypothetical protein n=1 Tax=Clostridium sp. TaxID=1506 RepID=UPI002903DA28|nr:hypothetical protein [Clostridium sp.]MDU2156338.1 hypothetical protein [Clostridium sp.]
MKLYQLLRVINHAHFHLYLQNEDQKEPLLVSLTKENLEKYQNYDVIKVTEKWDIVIKDQNEKTKFMYSLFITKPGGR